jgi:hypothetical protein
MGREADDKLTEALRSVLAQLTDARRKAEWLLETTAAQPPRRERVGSPMAPRPVPPS